MAEEGEENHVAEQRAGGRESKAGGRGDPLLKSFRLSKAYMDMYGKPIAPPPGLAHITPKIKHLYDKGEDLLIRALALAVARPRRS